MFLLVLGKFIATTFPCTFSGPFSLSQPPLGISVINILSVPDLVPRLGVGVGVVS